MITVKDLLSYYKSKSAIARALGVSRQAVDQWGETTPIPSKRELKVRLELLPGYQWPCDVAA